MGAGVVAIVCRPGEAYAPYTEAVGVSSGMALASSLATHATFAALSSADSLGEHAPIMTRTIAIRSKHPHPLPVLFAAKILPAKHQFSPKKAALYLTRSLLPSEKYLDTGVVGSLPFQVLFAAGLPGTISAFQ